MRYAIPLSELKLLGLHKTARILAGAESMIYADAPRSVHNCSGTLAQDLTLQEARSIGAQTKLRSWELIVSQRGKVNS